MSRSFALADDSSRRNDARLTEVVVVERELNWWKLFVCPFWIVFLFLLTGRSIEIIVKDWVHHDMASVSRLG